LFVTLVLTRASRAQVAPYERALPQSKATIEKVLQHVSTSGRLPVLDGFAAADRPLERYQRGYYQATIQVSSTPSGGSLVRVAAKITAWYTDPVASRSGYQLLTSNGRIETDILDLLTEQLAASAPTPEKPETKLDPSNINPAPATNAASETNPAPPASSAPATPSAPTPSLPVPRNTVSAALSPGRTTKQKPSSQANSPPVTDLDQNKLQAELDQLEEILKNQAHPNNLAAVKKSGTAVVSAPSLQAKALFLASAHDEFEILDFNQDWVHVRISGLSRGWIWRNDLEMPVGIPDGQAQSVFSAAEEPFRVTREETAPFPGEWEPLRGKNVKIISVQKTDEASKSSEPRLKLEFAKFLFEKNYSELAQKSQTLAGIVLIFDSSDGGMIAASQATLAQWKAGRLSDAALWHDCFFDPPEIFTAAGDSATQ
jgi:hypothetical protein